MEIARNPGRAVAIYMRMTGILVGMAPPPIGALRAYMPRGKIYTAEALDPVEGAVIYIPASVVYTNKVGPLTSSGAGFLCAGPESFPETTN
jgi:hypothetical protein